MIDREVVITHLDDLRLFADETVHPVVSPDNWDVYSSLCDYIDQIKTEVEILLKKQETKQYNNHDVACIIADLLGDSCACNFNDIDTWLPYKCDLRCSNIVGVACWEQYLKYKEAKCK